MASIAFQIETWTELGVGTLAVIVRVCARLKTVGLRNFRADDYLIVLVLLFWASTSIMGIEIARLGSIADLNDEEILGLTPEEMSSIELGGKLGLAAWAGYVCFIWTAKTCLLFYYNSFSNQLWHEKRLIKIGAGLLTVTFVVAIVTVLGHCRPIENNWRADQIPSDDCQYGLVNLYVIYSCHIFTDLYLLAIPVPILFSLSETQLSLSRKILLVVCICTGTFTIAAAAIALGESFNVLADASLGVLWGNREEFVWMIFLNAPSIASLFKRGFWSREAKLDPYTMSPNSDTVNGQGIRSFLGKKADVEEGHTHSS